MPRAYGTFFLASEFGYKTQKGFEFGYKTQKGFVL